MGKSKARTAPPAVEAEIKTEVAERRRRKAKEATPEVEVEAESPASPEPEAEEDELPDDGPDEDALAELLAEEDHEEHEEHEEGDEVEVKEEGGSGAWPRVLPRKLPTSNSKISFFYC